jgi:hypothetical protein
MTQKPELRAEHPETGKVHRWEIGDFTVPRKGDFALIKHGVRTSAVVLFNDDPPATGCKWFILRDLGPVEEPHPNDVNSRYWYDKNEYHEGRVGELNARVAELETENKQQASVLLQRECDCGDRMKKRLADLESRLAASPSPAPPPVKRVLLPVVESILNSSRVEAVFVIEKCDVPNGTTGYVLAEYMGAPSAVAYGLIWEMERNGQMVNDYKTPRHWILRRLDAPEEKQPEKPKRKDMTPIWSCGKYVISVDSGDAEGLMSLALVVDSETGRQVQEFRGIGLDFDNALQTLFSKYRALAEKQPEKPAPKEEPKPVCLPIHNSDGGGHGWFIKEGNPSTPRLGEWWFIESVRCAAKCDMERWSGYPVYGLRRVESPAEGHC